MTSEKTDSETKEMDAKVQLRIHELMEEIELDNTLKSYEASIYQYAVPIAFDRNLKERVSTGFADQLSNPNFDLYRELKQELSHQKLLKKEGRFRKSFPSESERRQMIADATEKLKIMIEGESKEMLVTPIDTWRVIQKDATRMSQSISNAVVARLKNSGESLKDKLGLSQRELNRAQSEMSRLESEIANLQQNLKQESKKIASKERTATQSSQRINEEWRTISDQFTSYIETEQGLRTILSNVFMMLNEKVEKLGRFKKSGPEIQGIQDTVRNLQVQVENYKFFLDSTLASAGNTVNRRNPVQSFENHTDPTMAPKNVMKTIDKLVGYEIKTINRFGEGLADTRGRVQILDDILSVLKDDWSKNQKKKIDKISNKISFALGDEINTHISDFIFHSGLSDSQAIKLEQEVSAMRSKAQKQKEKLSVLRKQFAKNSRKNLRGQLAKIETRITDSSKESKKITGRNLTGSINTLVTGLMKNKQADPNRMINLAKEAEKKAKALSSALNNVSRNYLDANSEFVLRLAAIGGSDPQPNDRDRVTRTVDKTVEEIAKKVSKATKEYDQAVKKYLDFSQTFDMETIISSATTDLQTRHENISSILNGVQGNLATWFNTLPRMIEPLNF